MKLKPKLLLSLIFAVIVITLFLIGTFFDYQISHWFINRSDHNFYGLFFEIWGANIFFIPVMIIACVFINWLEYNKNLRLKFWYEILYYLSLIIIFTFVQIGFSISNDGYKNYLTFISLMIYYLIFMFLILYYKSQKQKFITNQYNLSTLFWMVIYIVVLILTVTILKPIFSRVRMIQVMDDYSKYEPWYKINYSSKGNSFPSGHTASALTLLSILFLFKDKNSWKYWLTTISFWVIVVIIGTSRIVYLKHYLTDVTFSILIGIMYFYLFSWLNDKKQINFAKIFKNKKGETWKKS